MQKRPLEKRLELLCTKGCEKQTKKDVNQKREVINATSLPHVLITLVSAYDYCLEGVVESNILFLNKTCFCALPDGRLASASYDGTIKIWNLITAQWAETSHGHIDWVMCLCALPDGKFASGGVDGTIKIWNLFTTQYEASLNEHNECVTRLCILPDGRLASANYNNTINIWNLLTQQCEASLDGHTQSTCLCVLQD